MQKNEEKVCLNIEYSSRIAPVVWNNYLKLIVLKVHNFPLKLLKYYKKLLPVVEQKEPMYSKFLIVTQIKVIKFCFGFLFINYKRTLTLQNKLFFFLSHGSSQMT